jgi:hypothetical protein
MRPLECLRLRVDDSLSRLLLAEMAQTDRVGSPLVRYFEVGAISVSPNIRVSNGAFDAAAGVDDQRGEASPNTRARRSRSRWRARLAADAIFPYPQGVLAVENHKTALHFGEVGSPRRRFAYGFGLVLGGK